MLDAERTYFVCKECEYKGDRIYAFLTTQGATAHENIETHLLGPVTYVLEELG